MGYNVVMQAKLLSEALNRLSSLVIDHIVPNKERARGYAETSPALITLVSPKIGYDKASEIGKGMAKGVSIRTALKKLGYGEKEIDAILDMKYLVEPGIPSKKI
jgi:fumarate hydratase, class II